MNLELIRAFEITDVFVPCAIADTGGSSRGKGEIDEGLKLGDYPVLPWRSAQLNAPRGWWDNQDRRNKEDPVSHLERRQRGVSVSICYVLTVDT